MNEVKKEIFRLRSVVEELQTEVNDLAFENKNFAEFLTDQGYSDEGVSNIATGNDIPGFECEFCDDSFDNTKQITKEHLISYFEIDLDNCTMTNKLWVSLLTALINDPIKEIGSWQNEIEEYWSEREHWGNPWEDQSKDEEIVRYDQDGVEVFNSCVCQTLRFETCICGEVK